jgi:ParB family chromosome partitioning protein
MNTQHNQTIPLSTLRIDGLNPRATEPTQDEIRVLAASIARIGLLQPLIVMFDPTIADHAGVLGGGRRLRALNMLVREGKLDAEWPVPVVLYTDHETAREAAVAENAARAALNPLDEMEAYAAAIAAGSAIEDVAAAWAVSLLYVRQRLALANVPTELLLIFKAGEMKLASLQALAAATTGEQAIAAWQTAGDDAHRIKGRLRFLSSAYNEKSKITAMGGPDAYEAAGGLITRDLFSGDVMLRDTPERFDEIVKTFADGKARLLAHKMGATRFVWIEDRAGAPSIYPQRGIEMTDALNDELSDMIDGNENGFDDDDESEEAVRYRELDALSEHETWTEDQLSVGTAVMALDYAMSVSLRGVVVMPDEFDRAVELGVVAVAGAPGAPGAASVKAVSVWDDLSSSLVQDTANLTADVARNLLADKPQVAVDLLAWQVMRSAGGHLSGSTISGTPAGVSSLVPVRDLIIDTALGFTFTEMAKGPKASRLKALGMWAAARMTSGSGGAGAVLGHLGKTVRDGWTPDATYLGRLKKHHLMAVYQECTGAEWTAMNSMKKAAMVDGLAALFKVGGKGFDTWLPPSLRGRPAAVPVVTADEPDEQEEAA